VISLRPTVTIACDHSPSFGLQGCGGRTRRKRAVAWKKIARDSGVDDSIVAFGQKCMAKLGFASYIEAQKDTILSA
jgi:hypothetical protein